MVTAQRNKQKGICFSTVVLCESVYDKALTLCVLSHPLKLTWVPHLLTESHSGKEVRFPRQRLLFMNEEVVGKEM